MKRTTRPRTIAIVGAGPVGLEAALYARALGHRPTVYERGEVGDNVKRWGFVELFSPWYLNTSPLGLDVLRQLEIELPSDDSFPSGDEFRRDYLVPVAASLGEHIVCGCDVVGIARQGLLKGEAIGDEDRTRRAFRLLLRHADGREESASSDVVIDATGVYQNPCSLGDGGLPAAGERSAAARIDYHLPDILGSDRPRFEGRTTLLVGSGYSASTALAALIELRDSAGTTCGAGRPTEILWLWRRDTDSPLPVFENDPLPERNRLAKAANAVVEQPPDGCSTLQGMAVERIATDADRLRVTVRALADGRSEDVTIDRILALVGYRPDLALSRELQVHLCYATEGPMKLAAALLGSDSGGDCLSQVDFGDDSIVNPETRFFVIGHKSYGRRSDFLLRHGREQVRDVFRILEGDRDLDLYER